MLSPGKKLVKSWLSLVVLVFTVFPATEGQTDKGLHKDLAWSQPENEIQDLQFSRDGNLLVFATRVHWPDGGDAMGLPESFFKQLRQRKKQDPRFADPVVKMIDLKGNPLCEVRYGTNPNVSPDNKSIVFSRQKKPISGFRIGADTLKGNDIRIFDCETKQVRTVAQPKAGYLDEPFFLSGGQSIVYALNEAVNGASGGPVGVTQVDLAQDQEKVLLDSKITAAVPCPAQDSACRQSASASFPDLVLGLAETGGEVIALAGKPLPGPGDTWLAGNYIVNLISVFPERDDLLSIGKMEMDSTFEVSIQSLSGARVMIFLQYWRPFSVQTKQWLPDPGPRNRNHHSVYSPDMRYYLAEDEERHQYSLFRVADGKRLATLQKAAELHEAVWSPDSKRFAVVFQAWETSQRAYHDDLIVYSIQ